MTPARSMLGKLADAFYAEKRDVAHTRGGTVVMLKTSHRDTGRSNPGVQSTG